MVDTRISELTALGADVDAADLLEVTDVTGVDSRSARADQIVSRTLVELALPRVSGVEIPLLGSPTFITLEDALNINHSAGWISGGVITIGTPTSTVDVAAGVGFIRATNSAIAQLLAFDWALADNLALTDNSLNFIIVDYNGGSPVILSTITEPTQHHTGVLLGTVYREGTDLHITESQRHTVGDHAGLMVLRLKATAPFARESGGVTTEVGTRNIAVSLGIWWEGLTRFTTSALDTSAAGTFIYYHRDGSGGWTATTSQTQINNTNFDDGDGTLGVLTANRYGVHWVYVGSESNEYSIVYGTINGTLAQAEDSMQPSSVPPWFDRHARLIAKIVIQQGASVFQDIILAFGAPLIGTSGLSDIIDDISPQLGANLDVNGFNITMTGSETVDGRDLSSDGSKLDTIENDATADQSNVEIKTAYEANADTNEFSNAEQTNLGNQSGTNTGDEPSADLVTEGVVERATQTEVDTGTDVSRYVTPQTLAAFTGFNLYSHPDHTGDVTSTGDGATVIVADSVTYAKMQNVVADERLLGNVAGAGGIIAELDQSTVITFLGIEADATADQSDSEIKTAYENNADTNEFSDAEQTLLGNQSGTNTGDEVAADTTTEGIVERATQDEVDAGTDVSRYVTPQTLLNSTALTNPMININGNFDIWQRGILFTVVANEGFSADRWVWGQVGSGVVTIRQGNTTPDPVDQFSDNYLEVEVTTADLEALDAGDIYAIGTRIEGFDTLQAGFGAAGAKDITVAFWVNATVTGTHSISLRNSATNRAYVIDFTVTTTVTWEKITVTFPGDISGTWLTDKEIGFQIFWNMGSGSNFEGIANQWNAANDLASSSAVNDMETVGNFFRLSRIKIEISSIATPFISRMEGEELRLAKKYYQRMAMGCTGVWDSTTQAFVGTMFPVEMRAIPAIVLLDTTPTIADGNSALIGTASTIDFSVISPTGFQARIDGFTGANAGHGAIVRQTNDMFELTAEL